MNIRLRNIGVIKDSTIKINGLTVITGQNNSGKTTVGKVLYSLVDAVDNIKAKSDNDRYEYAIKNIQKTNEKQGTDSVVRLLFFLFFTKIDILGDSGKIIIDILLKTR